MSDRLRDLRISAADEHDMVRVTVDASGALTDLGLSRRIQQIPPDEVAEAILATIRDARGRLADRSQEIITETLGTDGPARALAARVDRQMRGEPA